LSTHEKRWRCCGDVGLEVTGKKCREKIARTVQREKRDR